jgi:hypothetical protein
VEIIALDDWAVVRDGRPVLTTSTACGPLLHALVLARDPIEKYVLYDHLRLDLDDHQHRSRFNTHLGKLRKLGLTIRAPETVRLGPGEYELDVDLWRFFRLVDEGPESYRDARELIRNGKRPCTFGADDLTHPVWGETLRRFDEAKRKLESGPRRRRAASQVELAVSAAREELLGRPIVPGVMSLEPVGEARDAVEALDVPWRYEVPGREPVDSRAGRPIRQVLADDLEHEGSERPFRVIVTGSPGSGKTLTGVSTFLELAERFEARARPTAVPLYFHGEIDGLSEAFGTDAWLEEATKAAGLTSEHVPVLVISHADVFLARHAKDLHAVLSWKLLRGTDVLLCVGRSFYARHLRHSGLNAGIVTLEPWPRALQMRFAKAVKPDAYRALSRWLDRDPMRVELCCVPLNLVFALSLAGESGELSGISTPAELFERVARFRLEVTRRRFDLEDLMAQLGAVAHRFYSDTASQAGTPAISFTRNELRNHFAERAEELAEPPRDWADHLEFETLLSHGGRGDADLTFEHPSWGWFFVAQHIADTVVHRPREVLTAFSKFLTPEIGSLCVDLLAKAYDRHGERVLGALRTTFQRSDDPAGELDEDVRVSRIARQQVGYYLGATGRAELRDALRPLVDPSSERHVTDSWVRRGILFGLADGGDVDAADAYVELLRAEREAGESSQRDTNIGFFLTFRGDQPFVLGAPDAISDDPRCVLTVAELVRGLGEAHHRGSWRIKLHTLLDLSVHPKIPRARFRAALQPHRGTLEMIHGRLQNDAGRRHWPEIGELSTLLTSVVDADKWKD